MYGPIFCSKQTGGGSRLSHKRGQIGGPKSKLPVVFQGFSPKREPAPSCRLCTQSGLRCINSRSQFHRKYFFGQDEEEIKLCLIIVSVPWYMLAHTAIFSDFLTFITGNWVRVGSVRFGKGTSWHVICKSFQITAHPIFGRFDHVLVSGVSFPVQGI